VQSSISENISISNETRYNQLNRKLEHLRTVQNRQYAKQHENSANSPFYTPVKNLSDVKFSTEEINILETGHNYALESQPKHFLRDLIIDTENAINTLTIIYIMFTDS
jgi:hypothetical protein